MTYNNLSRPLSPRTSPPPPAPCAYVFALLSKQQSCGKEMTCGLGNKPRMSELHLGMPDGPFNSASLLHRTIRHSFLPSAPATAI